MAEVSTRVPAAEAEGLLTKGYKYLDVRCA